MPFGKGGHFSINPQQAKMHDESKKQDSPNETHGDPQPRGEHPHKIEIHHPDGQENPSPGNYHAIATTPDGQEQHTDHAELQDVHKHMDEHWEGGMLKPSVADDMDGDEFEAPTMGAVKKSESGGY